VRAEVDPREGDQPGKAGSDREGEFVGVPRDSRVRRHGGRVSGRERTCGPGAALSQTDRVRRERALDERHQPPDDDSEERERDDALDELLAPAGEVEQADEHDAGRDGAEAGHRCHRLGQERRSDRGDKLGGEPVDPPDAAQGLADQRVHDCSILSAGGP